jgi:hypothetical protein
MVCRLSSVKVGENHVCIRVVEAQVYIQVRTKNKEQSRKGVKPNILGQTPTQAMTSLMADTDD